MVSYTTVSPLPISRRFTFCCTFPRVAPGGCYPPPCSLKPGLSSAFAAIARSTQEVNSTVYIYSQGVGVLIAEITDKPINTADIKSRVCSAEFGAVVEFQGVVRNHDKSREVKQLEYEGHESALTVVKEIAEKITVKYPLVAIGVSHRLGALTIGDLAFYVVTASAHRAEAFDVNRILVEEIKEKIPVWKNQIFIDGSNEWVNSA